MVLKPHGGYLEVVVNAENGTDRDGTGQRKTFIHILEMVHTKMLILQMETEILILKILMPKMSRL